VKNDFPQAAGVNLTEDALWTLVSSLVTHRLGWLFRRPPWENRFRLGGYIEPLTSDGRPTGRCMAVQIKRGESLLGQRTPAGHPYPCDRDDIALLHHASHQGFPLLLVLSDPASGRCLWKHLHPEEVNITTERGVTLIPSENALDEPSKERLEQISESLPANPESAYHHGILRSTTVITCPVIRRDVERGDHQNVVSFFRRLHPTREVAQAHRGSVDLWFHDCDQESRDPWEIPEVVRWTRSAEPMVKYWLYFLSTRLETHGLVHFVSCLCDAKRREGDLGRERGAPVVVDRRALDAFLKRHRSWLGDLSQGLGLPGGEVDQAFSAAVERIHGAFGER
jgi:hypothetical protein